MNKIAKNVQNFSLRLKNARQRAGLTQLQLAKKLGLKGNTAVYRFESGISSPSIEILCRLAEVLNADLHELITGKTSPSVTICKQESQKMLCLLAEHISKGIAHLLDKREAVADELRTNMKSSTEPTMEQKAHIDFLKSELFLIQKQLSEVAQDQHYVVQALSTINEQPL